MKHLYNVNVHPPGEFRYWVPETKTNLKTGGALTDLVKEIRAHYAVNGLTCPDNISDLVEDYICSELPGGWCHEEGIGVVGEHSGDGSVALDYTRMIDGTLTLARFLLGGRKIVDQSVAEKRGAICVSCRFNQTPLGCTSCNRGVIDRAVERVVGGARTSHWDQLHACGVCGCGLRAKIWIGSDVLGKNLSDKKMAQFPAHCWLKQELAN